MQKHSMRASGVCSLHKRCVVFTRMKHLAKLCSLFSSRPRRIPDGEATPSAGPPNRNPKSRLICSIIRVCDQCDRRFLAGRVEITALLRRLRVCGRRDQRGLMKTRHDGFRVICASRRRWRLASTGFVSKVMIRDAIRADGSNLQFIEGVAQSRD